MVTARIHGSSDGFLLWQVDRAPATMKATRNRTRIAYHPSFTETTVTGMHRQHPDNVVWHCGRWRRFATTSCVWVHSGPGRRSVIIPPIQRGELVTDERVHTGLPVTGAAPVRYCLREDNREHRNKDAGTRSFRTQQAASRNRLVHTLRCPNSYLTMSGVGLSTSCAKWSCAKAPPSNGWSGCIFTEIDGFNSYWARGENERWLISRPRRCLSE